MKISKLLLFGFLIFFICQNKLAFSGENKNASSIIPAITMLLLNGDVASAPPFFHDDFQDGNDDGWVKVDDSGKASTWSVENGKYLQNSPNDLKAWQKSYPLGSFSYYDDFDSFDRSNYYVAAKLRSLLPISGLTESVGIMFRYKNPDNYLRLLISKSSGYVRLEKKINDVFSTLAFNGRPPAIGSTIDLKVYVIDNQVFAYINNEPVFSASDPDLALGAPLDRGTIALFTYSLTEFDDITIGQVDSVPRAIISEPMAYSVFSTAENPSSHEINASAVAANVPPGGGVRFVLDSTTSYDDYTAPYSVEFLAVSPGEHQVVARIINSSGQPIFHFLSKDQDTNLNIGIAGKYMILFGDSISNGVGDDSNNVAIGTQNDSANGKNLNRGIAPVLNDLISSRVLSPVVVYNEGLGGTTANQGLDRLDSTIERHDKEQLNQKIWLILFGTNDSGGSTPVPSTTFKSRMKSIVSKIKSEGDIPLLGKVPYVKNAPAARISLIQEYNDAIDELISEENLSADPPDFFNYFFNNPSRLPDNIHPDGVGYGDMAKMWFCELTISGIIPGSAPAYCADYQY
jgi:lysophospholipase L1-like esterase